MKEKPDTLRQRKLDQRAGFFLFFIVNLVVLLIAGFLNQQYPLLAGTLPWLVNGGLIFLGMLARPHMALGYLAAIFWLFVGAAAFSALFVGSCLAGLASAVIVGPLGIVIFLASMFAGSYWGGGFILKFFTDWWALPLGAYGDESARFSTTDRRTLEKFKRGEIEIGDDGELRSNPPRGSEDDEEGRRGSRGSGKNR